MPDSLRASDDALGGGLDLDPRHREEPPPADGVALCLSGGGYRAMLFHLGALWRLNEAGWLPKLDRVSSVSGGSIAAGVLGLAWPRLAFGPDGVSAAFRDRVVAPIRALAARTIDVGAVLKSLVLPGSASNRIAAAYDDTLFRGATLQDLPDRPVFVFNATNAGSGALFRFTKGYARDWRVGRLERPRLPLATAVAASSAFPPVLSPLRLRPDASDWAPPDLTEDLALPEFREELCLSDGGVYDNLGLETAFKRCRTVLVSDGGGKIEPQGRPSGNWVLHAARVLFLIDNQVRSFRVRQLVEAYVRRDRLGAYWGIRTPISDYRVSGALPCPPEKTALLAATATRLASLDEARQERLVNWGYAIADAALRAYADPTLPAPTNFPYPASGVG